ncbi:MAG: M14 metallopeptidase family protein [Flavobacteriaceae bacterium]
MVDYKSYVEESVRGRYVTYAMLKNEWLDKLPRAAITSIGVSVQKTEIISITLGTGPKKILMWSQMHGNESTTTKAVLDVVNYLDSGESMAQSILANCTFFIIPILNPDGARQYTRINANKIDLNRDAKLLSQPESRVLRNAFESFKPDYCFNLHDQRTLFSAGNTSKSATVSFLSPASDEERKLTPAREKSMKLIVAMENVLQQLIPGQLGRYDDAFNDNCVGDTFQMKNTPTILFEAGHFPGDYEREKTREFIFYALIEAIKTIANDNIEDYVTNAYFNIPENKKLFYDVIVKAPHVLNASYEKGNHLGIRFKEVLNKEKVQLEPELIDTGELKGYFGHEIIDCLQQKDLELVKSRKEILNLVLSKTR